MTLLTENCTEKAFRTRNPVKIRTVKAATPQDNITKVFKTSMRELVPEIGIFSEILKFMGSVVVAGTSAWARAESLGTPLSRCRVVICWAC